MSERASHAADSTPVEPPSRREKPVRQRQAKPQSQMRLLPLHAVILHNDPLNGMDHVVGVLRRVFKYNALRCIRLMLVAHFRGRVSLWTGSLEVAELKAEQVRSQGPDPRAGSRGARRLTVSIEKLP